MKKSNINSKKGFTIIEVVLVLAIAGLIFLMVFVALPNLQRTQRDTQRRDDVARLSTALTQYITNNNSLPMAVDSGSGFFKNYLNAEDAAGNAQDDFTDPNGEEYILNTHAAEATKKLRDDDAGKTVGGMTIITEAKCDTEDAYAPSAGSRKFAIIAKLEGSGYYCADNN